MSSSSFEPPVPPPLIRLTTYYNPPPPPPPPPPPKGNNTTCTAAAHSNHLFPLHHPTSPHKKIKLHTVRCGCTLILLGVEVSFNPPTHPPTHPPHTQTAQIWALHTVRFGCTLILLGVGVEGVRYRKASLLLLILTATVLYMRTMGLFPPPTGGGRGRGPLHFKTWLMDWLDCSLKDKNRVKVIVMGLQVLPAATEIYGLVVLFIRVHQQPSLPFFVLAYLSITLLLLFLSSPAPTSQTTPYPLLRIRMLKLGLQLLCLVFVLGASDYVAFWRLLGPALIATGSSIFLTLSPQDMDRAVRSALALMLQDVCLYTRNRISDDELLQVALCRWMIEYWSEPTDFSWEDFLPMLQHTLLTLREEMVEAVQPSLLSLHKRLESMNIDDEAVPLVQATKARIEAVAPTKRFTAFLIFYSSTRHLTTAALVLGLTTLFTLCGIHIEGIAPVVVLPWALFPLILQDLYLLYTYLPRLLVLAQADSTDADGLSLLLQGTSLLVVWENLRYAVRALEGGLHVVRIYQTSVKALSFIHTMKLCYARAQSQYASLLQQQQQARLRGGEGGGEGEGKTTEGGGGERRGGEEEEEEEEEAAALIETWSFAAGWAMMELLRIKSSPNAEVASAAGGTRLPPTHPPTHLPTHTYTTAHPSFTHSPPSHPSTHPPTQTPRSSIKTSCLSTANGWCTLLASSIR